MNEKDTKEIKRLLARVKEPRDSKMLFCLKGEAGYIISMERSNNEVVFYHSIDDEMHYTEEDIEFENLDFEEGKEGIVLIYLDNGYEIIYMDLNMHVLMWKFLDLYEYSMEPVYEGVRSYLIYCMKNGINHQVLSYSSGKEISDMYKALFDFKLNDFDILYFKIINCKRYMLGFRVRDDMISEFGYFVTDAYAENILKFELSTDPYVIEEKFKQVMANDIEMGYIMECDVIEGVLEDYEASYEEEDDE